VNHPGAEIGRQAAFPIGIFDSGVGGLSVLREIRRELPHESLLYLADQAHIPYGPRPVAELRGLTVAITHFLLDRGAKAVVVACNTASAAALDHLRAAFPSVPFVGMEPAVKPAAQTTRSRVVGVIATPTTLRTERFSRLVMRHARGATVLSQVCPGLVEQVEAGDLAGEKTQRLLRLCLDPLLTAGMDTLVLGCTHYPFLVEAIRRVVGPGVRIMDPGPAVARQVRRVLEQQDSVLRSHKPGSLTSYTTGDPLAFESLASSLVGDAGHIVSLRWSSDRTALALRD
jgi:glutamate racemase